MKTFLGRLFLIFIVSLLVVKQAAGNFEDLKNQLARLLGETSNSFNKLDHEAEGNPDHTDKTKARPKSQKGGELHSLALAVETCNTLVNHNLIGLVARLHDPESMTNEVETDVAGLLQALRAGISCAHAIFDEKKAHFKDTVHNQKKAEMEQALHLEEGHLTQAGKIFQEMKNLSQKEPDHEKKVTGV